MRELAIAIYLETEYDADLGVCSIIQQQAAMTREQFIAHLRRSYSCRTASGLRRRILHILRAY